MGSFPGRISTPSPMTTWSSMFITAWTSPSSSPGTDFPCPLSVNSFYLSLFVTVNYLPVRSDKRTLDHAQWHDEKMAVLELKHLFCVRSHSSFAGKSRQYFMSFMCIVSVHVYICDSVGGFLQLFMMNQFFSYILSFSFSPCFSLHLVFVGSDHIPYLVVFLHSLHKRICSLVPHSCFWTWLHGLF